MPSSSMNNLAEADTKASLANRSPDIVVNTAEGPATTPLSSSQATLLGIPQELRNKIFEYVYGELDKPGSRIEIKHVLADNGYGAIVDAASYHTPPSKNAILVCRQIYTEMRSMQAAAFRHYWSESTFDITFPHDFRDTSSKAHTRLGPDIQHVKHFTIRKVDRDASVAFHLDFERGKWTLWFHPSGYSFWVARVGTSATASRRPPAPAPQGPQRFVHFEEECSDGTYGESAPFRDGRKNMDPELGLGFTAVNLWHVKCALGRLIDKWSFEPL